MRNNTSAAYAAAAIRWERRAREADRSASPFRVEEAAGYRAEAERARERAAYLQRQDRREGQ